MSSKNEDVKKDVLLILKSIRNQFQKDYEMLKNISLGSKVRREKVFALDEALLALESVESLKARVVSLSEQKEKLNDLIGQLELESKDFECCLEVLGKIKKELGGEVKKQ